MSPSKRVRRTVTRNTLEYFENGTAGEKMLGAFMHSVVFVTSGRLTELRHAFKSNSEFYDSYNCYLHSKFGEQPDLEANTELVKYYKFIGHLKKLRVKPGKPSFQSRDAVLQCSL